MIKDVFLSLGLTEVDATIYQQVLKLRRATPAQIAKAADISRENTYYVLKKLCDKGLVDQVPESNRLTYQISGSNGLSKLFEEKEQALRSTRYAVGELIKEIDSYSISDPLKPAVRYYENIAGIKQAYFDFMEQPHTGVMMGIVHRSWPAELTQFFVIERIKKHIDLKLLSVDSRETNRMIASDEVEDRQTRSISADSFPAGTYLAVLNDSVLIVHGPPNSNRRVAIVMEHHPIALAFTSVFTMLWNRPI